MGIRDLLFIGLVLGGAAGLGASLYPPRLDALKETRPRIPVDDEGLGTTVRRLDASFRSQWAASNLKPASHAPELAVLRRLALALTGSIPSLEELRHLDTLPEGRRAGRYVEGLINDRRYADYFAERFARAYVGTEGGPFLFFRRRRFVSWLSDQILANRPMTRSCATSSRPTASGRTDRPRTSSP
jgi:hypothetical protein